MAEEEEEEEEEEGSGGEGEGPPLRPMRVSATANSIGDEGAKAIAEALKLNSSLQQLNLERMPPPTPVPLPAPQCLVPPTASGLWRWRERRMGVWGAVRGLRRGWRRPLQR